MKSLAVSFISFILAIPAYGSGIVASQTAELKQVELDSDGREVISYIPASLVAPGETVRFTIEYENQQDDNVDNAILIMPIPKEMTYLSHDTTSELYRTKLSYDNTASFWSDGSYPEGYDPVSMDVTHIKWEFLNPIETRESGFVSAYAKLK